MIDPRRPFDFLDGERQVHYGRGRAADAIELLGGAGFTLVTTARASAAAPQLADGAAHVHEVRPGLVAEIAEELLGEVTGELVVALGGGRVVDTAKAIVAARGHGRAAAVPTTLSGAEMTRTHRQVKGTSGAVRPAVVINDPALIASQPVPELAASALNALAHAVEGPLTPRANPVATLAAHEGARLVVEAFAAATGASRRGTASGGAQRSEPAAGDALAGGGLAADAAGGDPATRGTAATGGPDADREALALGALLCGYAIDSAGYGLHHVLAQTMVRVGGAGHGPANAVLLPHTARALAARYPEEAEGLERAAADAEHILRLTGATTLRDLGVERDALARCAAAAATRTGDLANTPPPADREEILAIYERAW